MRKINGILNLSYEPKILKIWKKTNYGIDQVLDFCYKNKIEKNRDKLKPIISSLLFYAIHNLPEI
jgi:hypothetical protein